MRYLVPLVILLANCGNNIEPVDTWGDASQDLSEAFCNALGACYDVDADEIAYCTRHNYAHFCALHNTCKDLISEDMRARVDQCVADITEHDCISLAWGILPPSCNDALSPG